MSDTIYLILNESTFANTDNVVTEVVAAFSTLGSATNYIHTLADEFGVFVEDDANSVYLPPEQAYIMSDEYYIVEMELND